MQGPGGKDESLTDRQLAALLRNFADLRQDEKNKLLACLAELETLDPRKCERMKKIIYQNRWIGVHRFIFSYFHNKSLWIIQFRFLSILSSCYQAHIFKSEISWIYISLLISYLILLSQCRGTWQPPPLTRMWPIIPNLTLKILLVTERRSKVARSRASSAAWGSCSPSCCQANYWRNTLSSQLISSCSQRGQPMRNWHFLIWEPMP